MLHFGLFWAHLPWSGPCKILSYSALVGGGKGGDAEQAISDAFKDAALMGAVVVIEGFEAVMAPQGRHGGGAGAGAGAGGLNLDQLMFELDRFQGVVVIVVTSRAPFSQVCHMIDPDLLRRFKVLIELERPTAGQRAALWAAMIPSKVRARFRSLGTVACNSFVP